jgi:hypothetical protein
MVAPRFAAIGHVHFASAVATTQKAGKESPDRVDVDARLQQVGGRRMADYVRTDSLAAKWRTGGPQLRDVTLDHG